MRVLIVVALSFAASAALAHSDADSGWEIMQRHMCRANQKADVDVACYFKAGCRTKMHADISTTGIAEGMEEFLAQYASDKVTACKAKGIGELYDGG